MPDNEGLYTRSSCSALVITCSDFRFKSAERALAEACGLRDDYDLLARPGGVRSLVEPRDAASKATMGQEIALLHGLHGFQRVLLVNHLSCRAYDDIASGRDERDLHVRHLRAAAAMLQDDFAVQPELFLFVFGDGAIRPERINRL